MQLRGGARRVAITLVFAVLAVLISSAFLGIGSALEDDPDCGDAVALGSAPERKNCPTGFLWERLSGQCCVQDRGTLPENGKIGYTGNSLCEDGYVGGYEQRPTTDGEGPPGCPNYTSYAFLLSCTMAGDAPEVGPGPGDTPAPAADPSPAPGRATVGRVGDLANSIATRAAKPTPGLLAALGLTAIGIAGLTRWGVTTLGAPLLRLSELDQARLARDLEELKRLQQPAQLARLERSHTLLQIDRRLKATYDEIMRTTDPSKWTFDDYNQIVNALATVASIAASGGLATVAAAIWAASTALDGASSYGDSDAEGRSAEDITGSIRDLTSQIAGLRGTIAGELSTLESKTSPFSPVHEGAWLDSLSKIDPSTVSETERKAIYETARKEVVRFHGIGADLELQIDRTEQELFSSKLHRDSLRTLVDVSGEQDIKIDRDKNFAVALVTGIGAGDPKMAVGYEQLHNVVKLTPGALKLAKVGSLGTTALSIVDSYSKSSASKQHEILRLALHGHEFKTAMLQEQLNQLKPQLEVVRSAEAKALTVRQNAWKAAK